VAITSRDAGTVVGQGGSKKAEGNETYKNQKIHCQL